MSHTTSPTAAIKTLGCKLNQFESQQIREQLVRLGCRMVPFEEPADIYVINSCTVTSRTDSECRRLVRHAKRLNPQALVAVTGCYAEVNPGELEAIPEADIVVGNAGKGDLGRRMIESWLATTGAAVSLSLCGEPESREAVPKQHPYAGGEMVGGFAQHTRAFLKVQEGCDAGCTYCIIPRARGASRSVPPQDVQTQAERLVAAGFAELVLIGIHLGKYGADLPGAPDLTGLVEVLLGLPGLGRLRLSSIEPREVPDALMSLVAAHPRLCCHLHIPLQSGCDSVLRRMNRPYDSAFYADLARRIHAADPRICLGADVMVGFPGETDEEFEATFRLIEQSPLNHLHVFTYSSRSGTPAAEMSGQLSHEVKIARNHRLRDLSAAKRQAFAHSMLGEMLEVVFERTAPDDPGVLDGLSDNYLRVHAPGEEAELGVIRPVRIHSVAGDTMRGEVVH
jgi:threonylcarbamoyladenosine tRNA methylthiotransferase MtaB